METPEQHFRDALAQIVHSIYPSTSRPGTTAEMADEEILNEILDALVLVAAELAAALPPEHPAQGSIRHMMAVERMASDA